MKKNLKNYKFIIVLFLILIMLIILEIIIAIQMLNNSQDKFKEIIEIISSGLAILAASIGAYLGAKLNREIIEKEKNKIDKNEIKSIKYSILEELKVYTKKNRIELLEVNVDELKKLCDDISIYRNQLLKKEIGDKLTLYLIKLYLHIWNKIKYKEMNKKINKLDTTKQVIKDNTNFYKLYKTINPKLENIKIQNEKTNEEIKELIKDDLKNIFLELKDYDLKI